MRAPRASSSASADSLCAFADCSDLGRCPASSRGRRWLLFARRHNWFLLNGISYVLTLGTVLAWASAHYSDRTWLRTFLFLTLFCAMFVQILRATRRGQTTAAQLVAALLTTAPVLYHIAAIVLTARHPPAIHIYIIASTVVGLWLTADPHRPGMRLLVLFGSYAPLFGTAILSYLYQKRRATVAAPRQT